MFTSTLAAILGAIILISIVLPWFLIGVAAITLLYVWAAAFYRASARELKVCIDVFSPMSVHDPDRCYTAIGLSASLVSLLPFFRVSFRPDNDPSLQRNRPL
jgi:hypothetical protein